MKGKGLTSLLISLLVVSTLMATESTSLTKANPYLPEKIAMNQGYIKSNGDIDPPTLPIERSGNMYVLKGDIFNYTIEIQKDNVMLDGNGFSLMLSSSDEQLWKPRTGSPLIQISNRSNVIINNVRFVNNFSYTDFFTDISVTNSSNIIIIQNSLNRVGVGISMTSCTNSTIIGNEFRDNSNTPGFRITDSFFINIEYNNVSGHFHGAEIDNLKFSNISRNNLTNNGGAGLYLTGNNFKNNIFENNFINNVFGLFYQGDPRATLSASAQNRVYNNYWDNNYQNIEDIAADAISSSDQSPLASPISTSFDPSLFPLPSLSSTSTSEPFPITLVTTSIASVAVIGIGLLVYFKKRKR
ncbi:right-handed parallel beta-helix repeat-containing protein [Candidatus Bathyarchaeota archaeon A05DMB-2]|jgi:hypothetical protein|nr:right-handed parallel beta-helix repeat-containing protein [Candidatus Bathyarchaeota archaeon A05DMB-2]